MKYSTLKFGKILVIALLASVLCQTAWAGFSSKDEVYVFSRNASGSKHSARISSDSTQYIGCNISVTGSASDDVIACFARNKAGDRFYCYATGSSAANLITALETANDNSYLNIYKNSNGTCRSLLTRTYSKDL